MKTKLTAVMALFLVIAIAFSTLIAVSAANDESTINGKTAPVGAKVEYGFYLESDVHDLVGIQMVFIYDQNVLSAKSVEFPTLTDAAYYNNTQDGIIYINDSVLDGVKVSTKTQIAKITFEVIGEGTTDISYYIQYLYDYDYHDLTNFYDYKLTCSLAIDGQNVIEDGIPSLAVMSELEKKDSSFDTGDFVNTADGVGSGVKPTYSVDDSNDFDDSDIYDDTDDFNDDSDDGDITSKPAIKPNGVSSGRSSFISLLSAIFAVILVFSVFI